MLVAELYHNAAKLEIIPSLVVIKNGYLVAEDYFNGGAIDRKERLVVCDQERYIGAGWNCS